MICKKRKGKSSMNDSYKTDSSLITDEEMLPFIKSFSDGMPGGFFIYKAGGDEELVYVNKAMLRIFGCDTEEDFRRLTGNSFKGIVHPDDYGSVSRSIEEQIAGSPYNLDYVEYRIVRNDGSIRWVEDYGRYLSTPEGGLFYVFIEDATERMRERMDELEKVNAELKNTYAREHQYRKAILHSASAFFEVNLSRDEFIPPSGLDPEEKASDVFGITGIPECRRFSEAGKLWAERVDEKFRADCAAFFDISRLTKCYESGDLEQVFESITADASGKNRLLQIVMLIGKNEFTNDIVALAMIKDVTEARAKQRLFRTALSEANAENIANRMFFDRIYSDIRIPLNNIRCFTEMLSCNAPNTEIFKYCVDKITDASGKLLETVNGALKLDNKQSSAELGRMECDINELLREVKQRILPDASEKRISVKTDKSGVKHFTVYTDTIRLEEVLWQLLDNAVKYTGSGGEVTLKVTEFEATLKSFGIYRFEVTDNGIGISEDFIDRIFEPFTRESDPAVNEVRGSGMGLAVVKKITDMMEGTVSVKSEKGRGSCFTITVTLPLHGGDR